MENLSVVKSGFIQIRHWFVGRIGRNYIPENERMAMETQPFEDVSPMKYGDFSLPCELSRNCHSFQSFH